MKILNLYAGIGGNRKLWPAGNEITAIEINPEIAKIYKDFFPNDNVIVGDAHEYLLNHFQEFDFIWASPPCPSHSIIRYSTRLTKEKVPPIYPDMKLYQEIIFLENYFNGFYVVENVRPYYDPLVKARELENHLFWSNFYIMNFEGKKTNCHISSMKDRQKQKGFDISKYKIKTRKDTILRNCVNPELGLHIFNCIPGNKNNDIQQNSLFDFNSCGTDAAQIK